MKTKTFVARFGVAQVQLSQTEQARVRLEPLAPLDEDTEGWTDEQWATWEAEQGGEFSPVGDALVIVVDDDSLRPGQVVTLTMEVR